MSTYRRPLSPPLLALAIAAAIHPLSYAADNERQLPAIEVIQVVGSAEERLIDTPASAALIDAETLRQSQPLSLQDALRRVSGINVVETDGPGFFPRIGVRGLNPDMSKKVLLLEDGAPIALGPFTDPASYYAPPVERMEEVQVLKGAASLRYGPSTIGGAINYVTKNPPVTPGGSLTLRGGDNGYGALGLDAGGHWDNAILGVSGLTSKGAGARENSDYRLSDVVVKAGATLGERQALGIKVTQYRNETNSTYQGLSDAEYRADPYQNQANNDLMELARQSLDLNHEYLLSDDLSLRSLVYWNSADRNWWRENFAFDATSGTYQSRGSNGGRLRSFEVYGVDSRLFADHQLFGITNQAEIGVRLHSETMDNQRVDGTTPTSRSGTIREQDQRKADAVAIFVQNRFELTDTLALTPGVRVEHYRQQRDIARWSNADVNSSSSSSNTEWVPGVGATWNLAKEATLFAGVHRGFAPPRVQDAISSSGEAVDLDAERSVNYELGTRGDLAAASYELTLFRLDFSNQLVQSSQAGGASSQLTNAGETLHQGVEAAFQLPFADHFQLDANWTWVPTAKLDSTRIIADVDRNGNRLPYAPKQLANLGLSYNHSVWTLGVWGTYVGEQFADFENTVAGSANGKRGVLDDYMLWDVNASYQLNDDLRLFGTVKNLADETYISSRAPEGIFTGSGRHFQLGVTLGF
ncbi:MAG: TonB-dependent siderophore receptor [Gammaproteobacteria bacterium]|nr:TonB-dependent siderophore receptor [Gammaproteobacteria bacterium]